MPNVPNSSTRVPMMAWGKAYFIRANTTETQFWTNVCLFCLTQRWRANPTHQHRLTWKPAGKRTATNHHSQRAHYLSPPLAEPQTGVAPARHDSISPTRIPGTGSHPSLSLFNCVLHGWFCGRWQTACKRPLFLTLEWARHASQNWYRPTLQRQWDACTPTVNLWPVALRALLANVCHTCSACSACSSRYAFSARSTCLLYMLRSVCSTCSTCSAGFGCRSACSALLCAALLCSAMLCSLLLALFCSALLCTTCLFDCSFLIGLI